MTLLLLSLTFLVPLTAVHSYTPPARWGQAASIIASSLYIQGGKQDPFNTFGYDTAAATNELLFLPLTDPFATDSPPWVNTSSSANSSASQGPPVAWHTLSAFNSSDMLVFGGQPSPDVPIATLTDSGWLLDVYARLLPEFLHQPLGWADEPMRRIHHASVSSIAGHVYIFGGEKADGSRTPFSDHYVFDPAASKFTLLPTGNAPPALTGHAALILPNGKILIFGGLSPTGLLPFDQIWIFDITTQTWSSQNVSSTSNPSGRRGFAYVLLDENTILIHGGCDAVFQSVFPDGWVYNIKSATWISVPALNELGPRRDHFAVSYGDQVIFGFGYGESTPADGALQIYKPASSAFQPSFTPLPPGASVTQTIPMATNTDIGAPNTGTPTAPGSVHPTSTNDGGSGGGENNGGNGGGGDGGGKHNDDSDDKSTTNRTTLIAVGTVLGVLGLVAAGLGTVWYVRRQERHRWAEGSVGGVFSPIPDDEGGNGRGGGAVPAVRMANAAPGEKAGGAISSAGATLTSWGHWAAGAVGLAAVGGGVAAAAERDRNQRRDMLADEDTRDFGGYGWYDDNDGTSSRLKRDGSGGSSWSLMDVFRPKPRREGSAASGLSLASRVGGSLLGHADAAPSSEKDPFRDDLRNISSSGGVGVIGGPSAASRPRGGRQNSYSSVHTTASNYVDPFADPVLEEDIAGPGAFMMGRHFPRNNLSPVTEVSRISSSNESSSNDHQPLSPFDTISRSSFGFSSNSNHSPALPAGASPGVMSPALSSTSGNSVRPRTTSIIDIHPPDQPLRRSDTWWARFSSKSLLDRRASRSNASNNNAPDIRDPNPLPQRLNFVEEETASVLRERSDGSDQSRALGRSGTIYTKGGHGKSMSSLQTQRTADSAAIERMGGNNVDVVLRGNRQSGSTSTRGSVSTVGHERDSWVGGEDGGDELYTSPVEMVPASAFASASSPTTDRRSPSPPSPTSPRPPLSTSSSNSSAGAVAERIRAYERRMSQDVTPPPPTNTKQREERHKKPHGVYGLVSRPSLFVANPDSRTAQGSGDSS